MNSSAFVDALAQKAARIERCVQRARDERTLAGAGFAADFSRQDAALLNIQRACEQALDMGNMVIAREGWGLPRSARDIFATLTERGIIPAELASALQRMVGFRNLAVHEYQNLDLAIVTSVIDRELGCLTQLAGIVLTRYRQPE